MVYMNSLIISTGTAFDVAPASTVIMKIANHIPIVDINPIEPKINQVDFWIEGTAEEVLNEVSQALFNSDC